MGKEQNLIIGLDIGTTKICAMVGELNPRLDVKSEPSLSVLPAVISKVSAATG